VPPPPEEVLGVGIAVAAERQWPEPAGALKCWVFSDRGSDRQDGGLVAGHGSAAGLIALDPYENMNKLVEREVAFVSGCRAKGVWDTSRERVRSI